jgi:hypothetical protein
MTANIRAFVQALYGFDAVVQRMAEDDWGRPSPCDGWAACDVVVHVSWGAELFAGMARGEPASVPALADGPPGLSRGETDMDSWLGFATWDPLVHTWDLAMAVGQPVVADPALCEQALEHAIRFDQIHNLRRPRVARPTTVAARPDPLSRLLAFAGRDLTWQPG